MKSAFTRFLSLSSLLTRKGRTGIDDTPDDAALSEQADRRDEQLGRLFERMDTRSIQVLVRNLDSGMVEELGPGLDRLRLLDSLRPVLKRENFQRTPTLWRRVCQHAEHLFVNTAQRHPGTHWTVPRPLLRALESLFESDMPEWADFKRRYAQATTPQARIDITVKAALAVSAFLRAPERVTWEPLMSKASGLSSDQLAAALDVLCGCFGVAQWYLDVQRTLFGRDYKEFDSYFFHSNRIRQKTDFTDAQAERLAQTLETLSKTDEDLGCYLMTQVSLDLKDPAAILKVFPVVVRREMPERLEKFPYSAPIDYFVSLIERRTRELVGELSVWGDLRLDDAAFGEVTEALTQSLNALDRQISYLVWVVKLRPESAFARRVEKARLSLGLAMASVLLPNGVAMLEDSFGNRSPLQAAPTMDNEKLLASILGVAWPLAEMGGQNLAAAGSREQAFALMSRASNHFRASMFPVVADGALVAALTHTVCLSGRMGAMATLSDLRDRLGPVWNRLPDLWPCRDGSRSCCRALVRKPG